MTDKIIETKDALTGEVTESTVHRVASFDRGDRTLEVVMLKDGMTTLIVKDKEGGYVDGLKLSGEAMMTFLSMVGICAEGCEGMAEAIVKCAESDTVIEVFSDVELTEE